MNCRHCNSKLSLSFADLGFAPPSNAYRTTEQLKKPEKWFPLRVLVCEKCWLVQTQDFTDFQELFNEDYAYFSSFSSTWLDHAKKYVSANAQRFGLNSQSHVIEVAANDGYLLQYVRMLDIPCIGVEPTASTASAAREKGIPIIEEFFGTKLAAELVQQNKQADLTIANNVLAHVPDINDFVTGFSQILKPEGVATFEFPHLVNLVAENQFDTIYHEHFSYLSLTSVVEIFEANGLTVFDVEEIATHGGSLRVFAQRKDFGCHLQKPTVDQVLNREVGLGIKSVDYYSAFQDKTDKVKNDFLTFLLGARKSGKRVAAYGAAAKGNTLLNYAGIRPDLISYVVDKNPSKQNKFMPGSSIPIVDESFIRNDRPDYIIILPWNLREEIMTQLSYVKDWRARFITAIPELVEL